MFYFDRSGLITVMPYTAKGDTFQPGVQEIWSPRTIRRNGVYPCYDLTPDGKRVIAFPAAGDDLEGRRSAQTTVLMNFIDELKRRTDAG